MASAYNDALTVIDIRDPRVPRYVGTLKVRTSARRLAMRTVATQVGRQRGSLKLEDLMPIILDMGSLNSHSNHRSSVNV